MGSQGVWAWLGLEVKIGVPRGRLNARVRVRLEAVGMSLCWSIPTLRSV